ncbi:MAG TPA: hypothetical protein VL025_15355 [Thermoanaerobaculia bacterium]|nr:hypothetical protein [Thermoanaerobaculia bacterium]
MDRDSGPPQTRSRRLPARTGASLVLLALLAALRRAAKVCLFNELAYTSDLFSFVQMSHSFLLGRPLLHENSSGLHRLHHNTYLILLFAPLSHAWGALGIFSGSLGLSLLSWLAALRTAVREGAGRFIERWGTAAALLAGPVAFWIWDDPVYGWHSELLYLPLSVLFVLSLERRSRWAWLWAALLVLNREEGAVLAWSLHLLWILTGDREDGHRLRRPLQATAVWLAIFLAGFAWLRLQPGASSDRLTAALTHLPRLATDPELRQAVARELGWLLAILAIGLLPLATRRAWKRIGWTPVLALPPLAVILVGSATYASSAGLFIQHGPLWPPRFAILWGLTAAAVLLGLPSRGPGTDRGKPWSWMLACAASILLQAVWLQQARSYVLADRVIPWRAAEPQPASALTPAEKRFLSCLEDRVPVRTAVATEGTLFRYFHRHELVWPDHVWLAWEPPALVVCDRERRLLFTSPQCEPLRQKLLDRGLLEVSVGGIAATAEAGLEPIVSACAEGSNPG